MRLLETLGIDVPIVQAPMAGMSSPAMAAGAPLARATPAADLVATLASEIR
jgi:NAD(P)H-dependent flavin oxidoreductase YrpB (nitropropane dioxygenase family)